MNYYLIWHNEIIDETTSKKDARFLKKEYAMAYNGTVEITTNPTKQQLEDWEN